MKSVMQYCISATAMVMVLLIGVLGSSFLNDTENYKSNESGCAGSACHSMKSGLVTVKSHENLQVRLTPGKFLAGKKISAQLIDQNGRIVDFQNITRSGKLRLNAQEPGKYRVYVGYETDKPYWDSLNVEISKSLMSIPTSRFGTASFKFFPVHPNPAKEASIARFLLPSVSEVELSLFTTTGKKIRSIFRGELDKGLHEIFWETRDRSRRPLAPDTYLLELRYGKRKNVQRVYIAE